VSGNEDGSVCVWDTLSTPTLVTPDDSEPVINDCLRFTAHTDMVNGVK
jgi:hypothetical protein